MGPSPPHCKYFIYRPCAVHTATHARDLAVGWHGGTFCRKAHAPRSRNALLF
ncbi:hypothetical protein BGY98DRAFT_981354 [Russula aff. rugulosa BPL654]|nr:hypothetical protein BGY98DRAFT_981354 [Russula aff. rugulosa BPL654]